LIELAKHTDFILQKKDIQKKKENLGEKISRPWFSSAKLWTKNYSKAEKMKKDDATEIQSSSKINCVLADEYFTRCPISKEVFETFWEDSEGEFMYRFSYLYSVLFD
jgi:hypothetical protein